MQLGKMIQYQWKIENAMATSNKVLAPLRVIFAGPPDSGKSTLIGSLLTQSNSVFDDRIQTDLSFYTDGLETERERHSTLDVCYVHMHLNSIYRALLIDTPGQEELLNNFLVGATYADLAVVLTDATRPDLKSSHLSLLKKMRLPILEVTTKSTSELPFHVDSITGFGIESIVNFFLFKSVNNYVEV